MAEEVLGCVSVSGPPRQARYIRYKTWSTGHQDGRASALAWWLTPSRFRWTPASQPQYTDKSERSYDFRRLQYADPVASTTTPPLPLHHSTPACRPLDVGVVRDLDNGLRLVVLGLYSPLAPRESRYSLQVDVDTLLLGLLSLDHVLLDSAQELVSGLGVDDVLDADVDTLLHVSVADLLVQRAQDGSRGDTNDDGGLSVEAGQVSFVRLETVGGRAYSLKGSEGPAPFATMSTMSPTLYVFRYVEVLI